MHAFIIAQSGSTTSGTSFSPFFREPLALPLDRAEIEAIRRNAQIIHFNGGSKPWSYFCDHPRRAEYEKYLRMTEPGATTCPRTELR
jgi:hypothetical protein